MRWRYLGGVLDGKEMHRGGVMWEGAFVVRVRVVDGG